MAKTPPLSPSKRIWIPNSKDGFVGGCAIEFGPDQVIVILDNESSTVEVPVESVYPAEEDCGVDHDDNCSLMFLNKATLLNNIRMRFQRNKIYTYIANMLIAVNPYKDIKGLYSRETILKYKGKSLGTLPPHIFAIADKSFRDMKTSKLSQSIIVSGESGAGKTESTKHIMSYLCKSWGLDEEAGSIQKKILQANPVLESFGNAKTSRNNNSSRFGKFIEIHFEEMSRVSGGFISHYLLEKSRICGQSLSERNYHVFYQLLLGAPVDLKNKLGLENRSLSYFHYLNRGHCQFFGDSRGQIADAVVHDANDFKKLDRSLEQMKVGTEDRYAIYTIVAAVLHLGNIDFEEKSDDTHGGCRVKPETECCLNLAASLIGLNVEDLGSSLTTRLMQNVGRERKGEKVPAINVPLKIHDARNARDALAKALYAKLFDYIVAKINLSIPFKSSVTTYIGVLDIAGFEFFEVNNFEQLCINYCNEKLQQFFNKRVLSDEQMLFQKEMLGVPRIEYVDNTECIDVIERKIGGPTSMGIFTLLDEESRLPNPSDKGFTFKLHEMYGQHANIDLPRKSKDAAHRFLRDDEGFIVKHFAGPVCYSTTQFIEKNNDALHASLEELLQEQSGNPFLIEIFCKRNPYQEKHGKLICASVGSKFRTQLGELLEKLQCTGTSFISCIKPNSKMVAGVFEGGRILCQLQSAGMSSVLELMQDGFPSRVHFDSLYSSYKGILPSHLGKLEPRLFCRALFKAIGLFEQDFKFGLSRVFFKPGKFKEFDQIMRTDPESLEQMVSAVSKWIIRRKWKNAIFGAISAIKLKNKILRRREAILVIQKTIRMFFVRKRYHAKIQALVQISKIKKQVQLLESTIVKMRRGGMEVRSDFIKLLVDCTAESDKIKEISNPTLDRDEIEKLLEGISRKFEVLNTTINEKVNAEERERAAEARNQAEKKDWEDEFSIEVQPAIHLQLSKGDENTVKLKRENCVLDSVHGKRHNLIGWNHAELRDVINNSDDVELKEACYEEFYRRQKSYLSWRSGNCKKVVMKTAETPPKPTHSHLRVPITKESVEDGFNFPHYEKEKISAQFEASQGMEAKFLVSGRGNDHKQICEINLTKQELGAMRGEEILETEFGKEGTK